MIVRTILSGANLVTVKPSSSPLQNIEEDIDFAAMVPMQVITSLSSPETATKLAHIKQIIIGGAAVSPTLEQQLQQIPTACYGTYGMTETVSHIALRQINGGKRSPYYFALGKVTFEKDERECLIIHAPHLQQQTFVTNDIIQLTDATHFEWLGRHDNVIISRKDRISRRAPHPPTLLHHIRTRFPFGTKSRLGHRIRILERNRMPKTT